MKIEIKLKEIENIKEEIEWALAKPYYKDVYLNNAIRYIDEMIKEGKKDGKINNNN